MPLDPRIPLQAQQFDPTQVFPLFQQARQATQRNQLFPLQLQQQQAATEQQQLNLSREQEEIARQLFSQSAMEIQPKLQRGDLQGAMRDLLLTKQSMINQRVDTRKIDQIIDLFNQSMQNPEQLERFKAGIDDVVRQTAQAGPAGFQEFHKKALAAGLVPGTPEYIKAARVALRIDAPAVGSAAQTIAEEEKTGLVAGSEAIIEGAKAGSKEVARLEAQKKLKPQVDSAVELARKKAKEQGQAFTDVTKANAAFPGILKMVEKLKDLSTIATHTFAGKISNRVFSELNLDPGKGATARAQYINTVNTELFPLMRKYLGSQFTEGEGKRVAALLGDPDASPQEKQATLEAFVEGEIRRIKTLESEAQVLGGRFPMPQTQEEFDALQSGTIYIDPDDGKTYRKP